jgi:hypothetical protein
MQPLLPEGTEIPKGIKVLKDATDGIIDNLNSIGQKIGGLASPNQYQFLSPIQTEPTIADTAFKNTVDTMKNIWDDFSGYLGIDLTPTIADNAFQNTVNTMKNIWAEFRSWFVDEDKIALEEQKEKLEKELELYKDNAELKKQIKKELIEVEKKLEKEKFLWFDKLSQDQVKSAKKASGFIIGSTREVVEETAQYSKTAFELNKAFALADIAVKTSQAIMAAWTIPPPVGPVLAVAAGAAGAAQAALVTSQTFSGKEGGGMVGANSMYRVNEAGPEMFSVGGKDYLMTGSMGGNITPNDKISTSTGSSNFPKVTVNIITPEGTEARVEQNQQGDELQINAIIERLDKATAQGIRSGLSDTSSALSETFGLNRGVSAF